MKAIIAISENGIIGKGDFLPWPKIKEDMKFFKDFTMGRTLIMGSKTYFGIVQFNQLPGRKLLVASKRHEILNKNNKNQDHFFFDPRFSTLDLDDDTVIAGGKSIYEFYGPLIQTVYITHVKGEFDGDVAAPDFSRYGKLIPAENILETDKCRIVKYKIG